MNKPLNRPSILRQLFNFPINRGSGKTLQGTKQGSFLLQGASNHLSADAGPLAEPGTFERMGEYQAVLENHAQLSARRQHVNDVYVGLNTVFLTALGILLLQSHLDTWWVFVVVSAVTLIIMPINLAWRAALRRYGNRLAV